MSEPPEQLHRAFEDAFNGHSLGAVADKHA